MQSSLHLFFALGKIDLFVLRRNFLALPPLDSFLLGGSAMA